MTRPMLDTQLQSQPAPMLYPQDTVLRALEVMHRYGVHLLPVVDEQHGEVLGHVTEDELHRIWKQLPLARMSELLTARASVGIAVGQRPDRLVLVGGQGPRSSWLH